MELKERTHHEAQVSSLKNIQDDNELAKDESRIKPSLKSQGHIQVDLINRQGLYSSI